MHNTVLIEDLTVILCIAGIVTVLFQKIKQPTVLGYLIAGIIIGPYTPPFSLIDDESEIRILAELGVVFLMFSLGLEFSFRKLTKIGGAAIIIGTVEVVLMFAIGFLAGKFIGLSPFECVLLAAALSISSTTIIIKALEHLNLKKYEFTDLMIGVLLVEDMLAILMMVLISAGNQNMDSQYFVWSAVKLLVVIASWILIGYFSIPFLMRYIQPYINHETLTIVATGLCLFLSCVAIFFNYSAALGGFIMGSILAETPQVKRIEMLTLPIRDIFAAVFFVSVGMLIDPLVIYQYFPYVVLLSLITIVGKIITTSLGSLIAGQNISNSLRVGFGMAQIGEFSFILIGITIATPDNPLYPLVVTIAAITTFATPYLMKFSINFSEKIEQKLPKTIKNTINKYDQWIHDIQMLANQETLQTADIVRFLSNAIIIAIICVLPGNFLIPKFFPGHTWGIEFGIWAVTLIIASPFIWAMLFANSYRGFTLLKLIAWCAAIAELLFLVIPFLKYPTILLPLTLLIALVFKIFFKTLQKIYFTLENRLTDNLTKRKEEEDPELFLKFAAWDYDLIRFQVRKNFPFLGQTLEACHFRSSFGIYILAIKRNEETIWMPNAKEKIQDDDELVVLGNKKEIDQFKDFTQVLESLS